jgi:TetR/AcrR family transcriptional regulator, transcriptional repressor of bet genes
MTSRTKKASANGTTASTGSEKPASNAPAAANGLANARERVVDAFIECVVEFGIDGATYRAVAERAGVSLGTVQHYFSDKQAIIKEALLEMHRRSRRRRLAPGVRGARAVEARLLRGLPLTPSMRKIWPFYIEYWSQATRDPEVREFHVARWNQIAATLKEELEEESGQDLNDSHLDAEDIVAALIALEFGLGANATIHPGMYPADRARYLLRLVMTALLAHGDLDPPEIDKARRAPAR